MQGHSTLRDETPHVSKPRRVRQKVAIGLKVVPDLWKTKGFAFQIWENVKRGFFFKYHKKFKYKKQLIVGMRNHLQWLCPPFLEKVRSKVKVIKNCKTRSCWKCFWSFAGGVSPEKVTLTFHLVTLSYYGHPNLWILLCKRHREV